MNTETRTMQEPHEGWVATPIRAIYGNTLPGDAPAGLQAHVQVGEPVVVVVDVFTGWLPMTPAASRFYDGLAAEIAQLESVRAAMRKIYRAPSAYQCVVCDASGDWEAMERHCDTNRGHHFASIRAPNLPPLAPAQAGTP